MLPTSRTVKVNIRKLLTYNKNRSVAFQPAGSTHPLNPTTKKIQRTEKLAHRKGSLKKFSLENWTALKKLLRKKKGSPKKFFWRSNKQTRKFSFVFFFWQGELFFCHLFFFASNNHRSVLCVCFFLWVNSCETPLQREEASSQQHLKINRITPRSPLFFLLASSSLLFVVFTSAAK